MVLQAALLAISLILPQAQTDVPTRLPEGKILEIRIEGNKVFSDEEIRGSMYTRVGEPLDRTRLSQDLKFLWKNKRIRSLGVYAREEGGGVILTLQVEEVSAFQEITIRGNRELRADDILDAAKLTPGIPVDAVTAFRARSDIIQYYRDEGYFFADVNLIFDQEKQEALFEVMEGPQVRVSEIVFEGNESIPSSYFLDLRMNLESAMETSGESAWIIRGDIFKERTLLEDLIQLRGLYRGEGFRDAIVEIKDLVFSEDREHVTIHILVDEGPRYIVSSVNIEGNVAFPREELLALIELKPGDVYTDAKVRKDQGTLQNYYGDRGYPRHPTLKEPWSFLTPKESFSPEEARVDVTYRLREGQQVRIREVKVKGNLTTQDRVVRRQLTYFPGEFVNMSEVSKSLRRLASLDYFKTAGGIPALGFSFEENEDPQWKDLVLEVLEEGKTGAFNFGGGISNTEGAFGRIEFNKRNFDLFNTPSSLGSAFEEIFLTNEAFTGGGQLLSVRFEPGTEVSSFLVHFREPDLFGNHIRTTSLDTSLYRRRRFFRSYDENRDSVGLTLGKAWTDEFSSFFSVRDEEIRVSNIDFDAPRLLFDIDGRNDLRTVRLDFDYSDLDIPLEPSEGYSFRLSNELAGGVLGGDWDFNTTVFSGRWYYPLYRDERGRPYTFKLRGRFGYSTPYGDLSDVPYTERFFAGGIGSIRGFKFRGIGPVQNDKVTGGEAMTLFGGEITFPLVSTSYAEGFAENEWVRGVIFLDGGTLGTDIHDENFREVRLSAGTGLRIKIPVFPVSIALDFGIPLLFEDTDRRRVFSFTIGSF